jgi:hypothetical protein
MAATLGTYWCEEPRSKIRFTNQRRYIDTETGLGIIIGRGGGEVVKKRKIVDLFHLQNRAKNMNSISKLIFEG